MIIFRYLARNVLLNTIGVASVLMIVVVSSRFAKYLEVAATGKIDASVLFAIIGFRLPGFFELVLPLAFFLSILLAYGQLYVDSEMTVLHACGISPKKLVAFTVPVAVAVALIVACLSLYISPAGFQRVEELGNAQKLRGEVEALTPGRFYALRDDKGVTYAERISAEGIMSDVFLAQSSDTRDGTSVVVVADNGFSRRSAQTGENYLVLTDGLRVQGNAGRAEYQITWFEEFGQRLDPVHLNEAGEIDAVPTVELLGSTDPEYQAMLQWRLALPVMVLVVALLAVPLSKTNPRQGRFITLFPAVLLYVIYLMSLNAVRSAIEEQKPFAAWGMSIVHLVFLAIAFALQAYVSGWRSGQRKISGTEAGA
ncbi:MAG: LPS export ABC transporter permease LptF [Porticoccaceae bacterium]